MGLCRLQIFLVDIFAYRHIAITEHGIVYQNSKESLLTEKARLITDKSKVTIGDSHLRLLTWSFSSVVADLKRAQRTRALLKSRLSMTKGHGTEFPKNAFSEKSHFIPAKLERFRGQKWTNWISIIRYSFYFSPELFIFYSHYVRYSLFHGKWGRIYIQYSLVETAKLFVPNVRTLNISYSFSFLSRHSLFIIPLPAPRLFC